MLHVRLGQDIAGPPLFLGQHRSSSPLGPGIIGAYFSSVSCFTDHIIGNECGTFFS